MWRSRKEGRLEIFCLKRVVNNWRKNAWLYWVRPDREEPKDDRLSWKKRVCSSKSICVKTPWQKEQRKRLREKNVGSFVLTVKNERKSIYVKKKLCEFGLTVKKQKKSIWVMWKKNLGVRSDSEKPKEEHLGYVKKKLVSSVWQWKPKGRASGLCEKKPREFGLTVKNQRKSIWVCEKNLWVRSDKEEHL